MNLGRISLLQKRLEELEFEKRAILNELESLNRQVKSDSPPVNISASTPKSPEEKISLFLRLFGCRRDVFPKLWEKRTGGKKGYSPACDNEWQDGLCGKPKTKCSECPNPRFARLDESVIRLHLEGKITVGMYAIQPDDSCTFLAADFDKGGWLEDANAYKIVGKAIGIDVSIERSRSGNGAHAWIFFTGPVPAISARRLGTILLTHATGFRPNIPLRSYDRFFPCQDTLPKGGFGNLIALPLQRIPRKNDNSVFIDEYGKPYNNQWDYLANIKAVTPLELDKIISDFMVSSPKQSEVDILSEIRFDEGVLRKSTFSVPVKYNGTVNLILNDSVCIETGSLPPALKTALKRNATITNPKFYELQRMRFSTWNTPRFIACYEPVPAGLRMPRGLLDQTVQLVEQASAGISINDQRPIPRKHKFRFTGNLTKPQGRAVQSLYQHDTGVLVAPPGAGKTVMACALIGKRKVGTLILVHRKQLAEQWKSRMIQFLSLDKTQIGYLGARRHADKRIIHIGMLQTLARMKQPFNFDMFGMVIIDECHHIPAVSFENVLKRFVCRYILGLTATPYRKDGLQSIINMQCGPTRYVMKEDLTNLEIERRVIVQETDHIPSADVSPQSGIHTVWDGITSDPERLKTVAGDVISCLAEDRFPLLLSDRKEHLEAIGKVIDDAAIHGIKGFLLTGTLGKKQRARLFSDIDSWRAHHKKAYILATGSLIGEGFDLPALDTLILAMPISFKGRMIQYAGRLHRAFPGKKEVRIIDYLDSRLPVAVSMFRKRLGAYKKLGYAIILPEGSRIRLSPTFLKNDNRQTSLELTEN